MIEELCKQHTNLSDRDIEKIRETAKTMDAVADVMGADIFIDCGTRDPDVAIVVAHARPSNAESIYERTVVGQFAYRNREPAVLRTMEIGMPTMDMWAVTQENCNVRQNVSPIKNDHGKVIGVLIAEKDVTDRLNEQKNLSVLSRTTEQLMETLMSIRNKDQSIPYHVTDGVVMFNDQGVATYANPVAEAIYKKLGFIDNLEGIEFSNMSLDSVSFKDILDKKLPGPGEVRVGNLVLHIKYAVMKNRHHNVAGVVMLIKDETDVKAKEKELILKSVAIKEIHHRVKNNLQTIASLLRLQSRRIESDSAKIAFSKSIGRVLSIAATHEILAQNGVDDVDLKTMLQRIKNSIVDNSLAGGKKIVVTIEGDSFMINSDKATSIALVVNEVIQNCLKYAFVGRDEGNVSVEICKGAMFSNISITDDGVGFDVNREYDGSLGNKIVSSIVNDKLQGTLTTESSSRGTKVLFDFPLDHDTEEDTTQKQVNVGESKFFCSMPMCTSGEGCNA